MRAPRNRTPGNFVVIAAVLLACIVVAAALRGTHGSISGCLEGTSYHGWILYPAPPAWPEKDCASALPNTAPVLVTIDASQPCRSCRLLWSLDSSDQNRPIITLEGRLLRYPTLGPQGNFYWASIEVQ